MYTFLYVIWRHVNLPVHVCRCMFVSSAEHASCRSCRGCRGMWHQYPTIRNEAVGMDGNLANPLYPQVMKNVAF